MRIVAVIMLLALALAGCASTPRSINNVCSVFDQKQGFFGGWYTEARRAERKYGVPAEVLMATIRIESGFDADARPPRRKLLGFIPWKRASSAYGYSQALDGTWERYRRETGNVMARRTSFADAVDFVGWYHQTSNRTNGVALNDATGFISTTMPGMRAIGAVSGATIRRCRNPPARPLAWPINMVSRCGSAGVDACHLVPRIEAILCPRTNSMRGSVFHSSAFSRSAAMIPTNRLAILRIV